jgi:hypothetical protein
LEPYQSRPGQMPWSASSNTSDGARAGARTGPGRGCRPRSGRVRPRAGLVQTRHRAPPASASGRPGRSAMRRPGTRSAARSTGPAPSRLAKAARGADSWPRVPSRHDVRCAQRHDRAHAPRGVQPAALERTGEVSSRADIPRRSGPRRARRAEAALRRSGRMLQQRPPGTAEHRAEARGAASTQSGVQTLPTTTSRRPRSRSQARRGR